MHRDRLPRGVHRGRAIGAAAALVAGALTPAAAAQPRQMGHTATTSGPGQQTPSECRNTPEDIPSTSFQLSNGLTVVLHEDHKAPAGELPRALYDGRALGDQCLRGGVDHSSATGSRDFTIRTAGRIRFAELPQKVIGIDANPMSSRSRAH